MKRILKTTVMTLLLSLSIASSVFAHVCSPEEESRRTLEEINEERTAAGICPICGEEHMGCCSCARANEVCTHFSHTRPDGSPFYTVDPENVYGEILAAGSPTSDDSEEIVDDWMNSEVHRNEILNPNYTRAGSTVVDKNGKRYWVVEFGY